MKFHSRKKQLNWDFSSCLDQVQRRQAEKEAEEQRKLDVELMEARRQQRKLNYLITQTELYAHFIAKKLGKEPSKSICAGLLKNDVQNYYFQLSSRSFCDS